MLQHAAFRRHRALACLRRRAGRGLSLVELMVAVAVVGVLVGVAIPSLAELMERRRITAITQELVGLLNFARSETNVSGEPVHVHLEKDGTGKVSCALVNAEHPSHQVCACHQKPSEMCGGMPIPVLRVFQVENANGVSFEATADPWGLLPNVLTFTRGKFQPAVNGFRIDVTGKRTRAQLRVEMNQANRVRVCSPSGSMGGYPACSSAP